MGGGRKDEEGDGNGEEEGGASSWRERRLWESSD